MFWVAFLKQGSNWLQVESKYHLMCVQLALGQDMNDKQKYEVGVTAGLIRSLIEYEWSRGASVSARYVGMMRNCDRAKVVMGLVDAGTVLPMEEYIMPVLE